MGKCYSLNGQVYQDMLLPQNDPIFINSIAFQVFCQECYEAGSDHCPSCGRAVDGHSVRVNGSSFHSDCFVCCVCKKKMVNIPFVADDKNQVLKKSTKP